MSIKSKIIKGSKVKIKSGKYKNTVSEVLNIFHDLKKCTVKDVNLKVRFKKDLKNNGQIIRFFKEGLIDISKIRLLSSENK